MCRKAMNTYFFNCFFLFLFKHIAHMVFFIVKLYCSNYCDCYYLRCKIYFSTIGSKKEAVCRTSCSRSQTLYTSTVQEPPAAGGGPALVILLHIILYAPAKMSRPTQAHRSVSYILYQLSPHLQIASKLVISRSIFFSWLV